jgi:pyruvate/2-oxoacid:ferredoxin oxidoreductase beta subunit
MMKNTIKISALSIIFLGALLTSCNSTNDKKTMTDEEIATEHTKLAQVAHEKEMAEYQEINRAKIEANEKSLAEFNLRIKNEKMEAKDEYEQKMAELNAQNSDMKKKWMSFTLATKPTGKSLKHLSTKTWMI